MDMMRCLQAVNVDSNVVGWYTSANLGAIWTDKTISTQFEYQMSLKKSVLLVYDTARSQQGHVSLKAFRLTDAFMELYQVYIHFHPLLHKKKKKND
jgi:translation initiation factor 3 subunit H